MKKKKMEEYKFSKKERWIYVAKGVSLIAFISYLFYRSIFAFLILCIALPFYLKKEKEQLLRKQKKELTIQFKDTIQAVSTSLGAGYSIENAFLEAKNDLLNLYGKNAVMVKELVLMAGRLSSNETLESILSDLSNRSQIDDIQDFTDVFVTAKRSGGDLKAIIRTATDHITDKIEVHREIDTLMSAKKLEQKIMNCIPFFIILYVSGNSPGFLDVLYHNAVGIVVMTGCLLMYIFAFLLSMKIVNIEV